MPLKMQTQSKRNTRLVADQSEDFHPMQPVAGGLPYTSLMTNSVKKYPSNNLLRYDFDFAVCRTNEDRGGDLSFPCQPPRCVIPTAEMP